MSAPSLLKTHWALIAILLVACRSNPEHLAPVAAAPSVESVKAPNSPPAPPPDAQPVQTSAANEHVGGSGRLPNELVPFECPPGTPNPVCHSSPSWLVDLDRAATTLLAPTHRRPELPVCERAEAALKMAMKTVPSDLSWEERVMGQHFAVRVFSSHGCASRGTSPQASHPGILARQVAWHLALPATQLHGLGAEPMPDLDFWVGPRSEWRSLRSRNVPLAHDGAERFTRRFRPVRTATRRAIFSQVVAYDARGTPYVTPLVGRVEMRLGLADRDPGCVAKLDLTRLRCRRLRAIVPPRALDAQPVSFFVHFADQKNVTCGGCHGANSVRATVPDDPFNGDLKLLLPAMAKDHLEERRAAFEKGAAKLGRKLRPAGAP